MSHEMEFSGAARQQLKRSDFIVDAECSAGRPGGRTTVSDEVGGDDPVERLERIHQLTPHGAAAARAVEQQHRVSLAALAVSQTGLCEIVSRQASAHHHPLRNAHTATGRPPYGEATASISAGAGHLACEAPARHPIPELIKSLETKPQSTNLLPDCYL